MRVLPEHTDVVIVGAGPAGLTLACVLANEGVSFILLDRLTEGLNTSRAAAVHARTLEVLEQLNVSERMRANGHVVKRFVLRDRDRLLAAVPFDQLATAYPHVLMVPQDVTESILLTRLRELGGDVRRPYVVTELMQNADGVWVTPTDRNGHTEQLRARYVVGTDGMHSTVRERAGIGFTGEKYEQSFVLADVRMTWELSDEEVMLFLSPDGLVVVAPLPGGRHRIVATVDEAPEQPGMPEVQFLLDTRGPITGAARVREMIWSSRFRVHHRLADQYRKGRVLLAGDAAHVHSPAGGQGMNTGIQDSVVLGHVLAAVLGGHDDETALDTYESTRRPVAERVVTITDRMTRMATLRAPHARALRNTALRAIGSLPAVPRWLATELAGLHNTSDVWSFTGRDSKQAGKAAASAS